MVVQTINKLKKEKQKEESPTFSVTFHVGDLWVLFKFLRTNQFVFTSSSSFTLTMVTKFCQAKFHVQLKMMVHEWYVRQGDLLAIYLEWSQVDNFLIQHGIFYSSPKFYMAVPEGS